MPPKQEVGLIWPVITASTWFTRPEDGVIRECLMKFKGELGNYGYCLLKKSLDYNRTITTLSNAQQCLIYLFLIYSYRALFNLLIIQKFQKLTEVIVLWRYFVIWASSRHVQTVPKWDVNYFSIRAGLHVSAWQVKVFFFNFVVIQKWSTSCSGFVILNEAFASQLSLLCLHSVVVLTLNTFFPSHFGACRPGIVVPISNIYILLPKLPPGWRNEPRKRPNNSALQAHNTVTVSHIISHYIN